MESNAERLVWNDTKLLQDEDIIGGQASRIGPKWLESTFTEQAPNCPRSKKPAVITSGPKLL